MVEIIKQLCEKQKMTIKTLEEAVNLGNGTVRRWGKGNKKSRAEALPFTCLCNTARTIRR